MVNVVNQETLVQPGQFIYSRTNLTSIIEEANDAFVELSGYSREQLVGRPHNVVRHPDMPREAFEDMWRDLKNGWPWRGFVKNLRADGGFYWVEANVSPIRDNGCTIGYHSIRSRPSREAVAAAEDAYRRIKSGDRSIRIEHGRVVPAKCPLSAWLRGLSFHAYGTFVLLVLAGLAAAGFSLWPSRNLLAGLALVLLGWAALYLFGFILPLKRDLQVVTGQVETLLRTGDLTQSFELSRADRLGELARLINLMVSLTRALVHNTANAAHKVHEATLAVSDSASRVQDLSQQQSSALSDAVTGMAELTQSMKSISTVAGETRIMAAEIAKVAQEGSVQSDNTGAHLHELVDVISDMAARVTPLADQAAGITSMSEVIKDIADQTNLLALNAAIEAARAGETGRGFAVVADEVRKLADRSAKASAEITSRAQRIHHDSAQVAVQLKKEIALRMEAGETLFGATQAVTENLARIVAQAKESLKNMENITQSCERQQHDERQLEDALQRVDAMAGEIGQATLESSHRVVGLKVEAIHTETAAAQFRV